MLRSIPALVLSIIFLPSLVSAAAWKPNFIIVFSLMGQSDRKLTETARAVGRLLPAAEFYVSPSGNDANPGSKDRPLATLARARDLVRKLRKAHADEDVTVWIDGGTYRLTETLTFTLEDSSTQVRSITLAAAPGAQPVLSGAAPVRGWTKLQTPPAGLPPKADGKVWVADVSWVRELKQRQSRSPSVATQLDRGWRFFTLYEGSRSLPRARGPAFTQTGRTQFNGASLAEVHANCRILHVPPGAVKDYFRLADAELLVVPMYPWIMNILPIQSVDAARGVLRTSVPGTYPLGRTEVIDLQNMTFVENVPEELDEPGEWVLDSEAAKLYLWPQGEEPGDDIAIPLLTELIRVEGKIDYDGPRDTPVRNLVIRGLTFTQGDRYSWHGRDGWGAQHDWERFDSPSALVRFRGTEGCSLQQCRFVCAGGSGARLDLHAQKNRITDSEFAELGGAGIALIGYGPGVKDVNRRNEIVNNHVHHVGQLYWGSPGIIASQSGENYIAHNTIDHLRYTGICVVGRQVWEPRGEGEGARTIRWKEVGELPAKLKAQFVPADRLLTASDVEGPWSWYERERFYHARNNLIERNDIHHVMERLGDGNCIYFSAAGGGNRVRENYCHDCDGRGMVGAMRCDGDQHLVTWERNVVYRTGGYAEGIISKGKNDIVENVIVDLRRTYPRQRGYVCLPMGSPKGSLVQRNVLYACQEGQIVCGGTRLRQTAADHNLYFSTADPTWGQRHLDQERSFGIEEHSIAADPRFVDIEHCDFRFTPESPALKLGIHQPFDVRQAGVQGQQCGDK